MDIQTGINILEAIVGSSGFSALVVQGFKILKQMGVNKKLQNVENLAFKAVNAAHSVGLNLSLDDSKTYEFALNWAKNEASKHGIKYDDNSLQGFIEDAYQTLSKGWTEANAESIKQANTNSVEVNTDAQKTVQQTVQDAVNDAKQQVVNQFTDIVKNAVENTQEPTQQTVEPTIPVDQVPVQPPTVEFTQPVPEQSTPTPVEATPTQPQQ